MGARNVAKVFAFWKHLDHRQVRGLTFMANMSLDDDEPPVYFGGWESLSVALGKDPDASPDSARKAATRVISELRKAGAVEASPAVNQSRARYALTLDPQETFKAVGKGRGVKWERVPRGTVTVPPQGDTHCPTDGTVTVPPQGDTGGPHRGTLTVPRRSTEEPPRGIPNENAEEEQSASRHNPPRAVDKIRAADDDEPIFEDSRNDQLAALRARYPDSWDDNLDTDPWGNTGAPPFSPTGTDAPF
ncbi:hypothetical protein F7P69_01415 [Cellulosimicrobium funkei]|nr:hypothetical protein [Cellulosimicrobium funkei]